MDFLAVNESGHVWLAKDVKNVVDDLLSEGGNKYYQVKVSAKNALSLSASVTVAEAQRFQKDVDRYDLMAGTTVVASEDRDV